MKQNKQKGSVVRIIAIILGSIILLGTIILWLAAQYEPKQLPAVFTVTKRDVLLTDGISGQAMYAVTEPVLCMEHYPVQQVYVKTGDTVKKGDRLFAYQPEELDNQIKECAQQLAVLDEKLAENETDFVQDEIKDSLNSANDAYNMVYESLYALQCKNALYAAEIESASVARDSYDAMFRDAENETEQEKLKFQALVYNSRTEYYEAQYSETAERIAEYETMLNELAESVSEAKLELRKTESESLRSERMQALQIALRDTYAQTLEQLHAERDKLVVCAECDGIITECCLEKNNSYYNEAVMEIAASAQMMVRLNASADQAGKLKNGMQVFLTTEASGCNEYATEISEITCDKDGNYFVSCQIADKDRMAFRHGMPVYATVVLQACLDTPAVPYDAIIHENDASYVLVQTETGWKKTEVRERLDAGYYVAIEADTLPEKTIILVDTDDTELK